MKNIIVMLNELLPTIISKLIYIIIAFFVIKYAVLSALKEHHKNNK